MSSAEVHDLEARLGMAEAKRAVWADDDWEGGIAHCLDRIVPELTLTRTMTVLDYGCGMGRLTKPLAEDDGLDLTAYDPSVAMLDRAHEHLGERSGVRFAIEPPDEMFDLAYSVAVLQHLPPHEQTSALRWMASHAATVVVQFVTHPAEPGPLSHPCSPWSVVADLMPPGSNLRAFHLSDDDRFPTWAWATARYRR